MKNFSLLIIFLLTINYTTSTQSMELVEHAAEYVNSSFGNAPTSNGLIFVKRCDSCTRTGVKFNSETRYFLGKAPINAQRAEALNGQGATLFFNPKLRTVTRVIFSADKSAPGN